MRSRFRRFGGFAVLAASVLAAGAQAGPPIGYRLVKDLGTDVASKGSDPSDFVIWNGRAWFAAATRETGRELFVTDGSANGTHLAHEFMPGPASSGVRPLGVAGGRLVVQADDGRLGPQLWAYDGEGSTPELLAIVVAEAADFRRFGSVGGRLVLSANVDGPLWSTDGTAAGTVSLKAALANLAPQTDHAMTPCVVGDALVYVSHGFDGANRLVRTDGTVAGSQAIASLNQGSDAARSEMESLAVGGRCHVLVKVVASESTWQLWTTDGTPAGTSPVTAVEVAVPFGFATAGGAIFVAQTKLLRFQLLRVAPGSNQAETTLDLPGAAAGKPLSVANRIAFNSADVLGGGLYVGDGTTAGTSLVYPSRPLQPEIRGATPVALNQHLVFQKDELGVRIDAATGEATSAPTRRMIDLAGASSLGPLRIGAGAGPEGVEPRISDGSLDGTRLVADLRPGTSDGLVWWPEFSSAVSGDVLFFSGPTPVQGRTDGLWRTDGTETGTRRLPDELLAFEAVRQIVPVDGGVAFIDRVSLGALGRVMRANAGLDAAVAMPSGSNIHMLMSTGPGVVYFSGMDLAGSTDAQVPASVFWQGFGGHSDIVLGRIGGAAVFLGSQGIWRSDGTAPGTFLLATTGWIPENGDYPSAVFGGKMYFIACATRDACTLTATDGTREGTAAVRSISANPGEFPSRRGAFAVVGGRLVFVTNRSQIWTSDGTPGGTDILLTIFASDVSPLAVAGGKAQLTFECPGGTQCKFAYVATDGTPAGTRYVDFPPGLRPTSTLMAPVGDAGVVFSCATAATGEELCRANADGLDPRLLADTLPGPASSGPHLLGVTSDAVYVMADDGLHGVEPWVAVVLPERIFASGFEPTQVGNSP